MENYSPCVTVLSHDDLIINFELESKVYKLNVDSSELTLDGFTVLDYTRNSRMNGLTRFIFNGFTIYHQKGGDCYVE